MDLIICPSTLGGSAAGQDRSMTSAPRRSAASQDRPARVALTDPVAGVRLGGCLVLGLLAATGLARAGLTVIAPLGGWDAAALGYLAWTWSQIARADADRTAAVAVREDGLRALSDLVLLLAAVASLAGVGDVIMLGAARNDPISPGVAISLAVTSIVLSWAVVHTIFTLRYAHLYYVAASPGIDFKQDEPPRYLDFAYVAFTIGMTFQVSDTDLKAPTIRSTVLRHALLSYLFGAVIIAVTINLVAGLAK
jgi:uncharacterized membrane protein